jgi:predicted PurR-regulated permease PerM
VILRFVPYIGPIIAAVLPATLAAAVSPHWSMVVWTLGPFAVAELITGQFIEPMVYGFDGALAGGPRYRRSSGPGCGGRSA